MALALAYLALSSATKKKKFITLTPGLSDNAVTVTEQKADLKSNSDSAYFILCAKNNIFPFFAKVVAAHIISKLACSVFFSKFPLS